MPPEKSTRARILDAGERLMRTIGLARATTKEIARAAECSEAALYKHFSSKEELFVHVLRERLPRLNPLLDELNAAPHATRRTVAENLTEIACEAARFYEQSVPIAASLYAEPRLKQRHNEAMRELGVGPHRPLDALAGYLRAERDAGRLRPDADPEAAAALLLGACVQRVFLRDFQAGGARTEGAGTPSSVPSADSVEDFAERLVRTLLAGLGATETDDGNHPDE